MALNEKYSFKDFTGQDLTGHDPRGFAGTIKGSCFSNETPGAKVFPDGITSEFERCNLSNCAIPPTAKLGDGNQVVRFKAFAATVKLTAEKLKDASGEEVCDQDWEVGLDDKPIRPLDVNGFEKNGWPTDPKLLTLRETVATAIEVTP